MANDVTLNPGVGGAVVSTEALTSGGDGAQAQRIKLITGAANVDGGNVTSSNGLPVAQCDNAGNVLGVSAHPVRIDPVGTTTQPVSAASLPLPSGAAQDATLTARLGVLGQAAMAASAPVVIASNQSAVPVSGTVALSGTSPVSGTVTANQGTAAAASGAWTAKVTDGTNVAAVKAASTPAVASDPAVVVSLSPNSSITFPSRSVASAIGAASLVFKASAGVLCSLRVRNRSASPVYAMLFNAATVPADGTVAPFLPPFLIPSSSDVNFGTDYFTDAGLSLSTGISVAVSTTDSTTKTLATTAANHDISGAYL